MDIKGIVLWAGLLVIFGAIYLISRRMNRQIKENGIETDAVISRIAETIGAEADDDSTYYYVKYRTQDGEEVEGLLLNPRSDLEEGQRVRIKYHPRFKTNARLI